MQCENFILLWKQMNSTINKTLYTCFAESLFFRYEKISTEAVKLGIVFFLFNAQYIYF